VKAWLLAARPKTLSASVVPVLVGTALAFPRIRWTMFACALFGAVFIQIGTNLVNDALDFRRGADNSERLGPLRVTQAGLLSANAVLAGAYICFGLAALCGIPLVIRGGWPIVIIGIASILAAYGYTGGPYPLAYHGMGELFVLLFFGFIAVAGSYYVQRLTVGSTVWIAGLAVGCLAAVLLAINNLRDVVADRASAKQTLAVLFGERFAIAEIAFCASVPFLCVVAIAGLSGNWLLLIVLVEFPLAIALIARVRVRRGAELNRSLAMAGALQWAFGILFVIGCLA
jgi:1,4-dihydroxy-2-naphthoate octaprenyltransferase